MGELNEFKTKCSKAENIIADLKKAGSDSMADTVAMMKNFKTRERTAVEEIEKLKQLSEIKHSELISCDVEIKSLHDYLEQMNREQGMKINNFKQEIDDNKRIIRRQDKLIVDLQ